MSRFGLGFLGSFGGNDSFVKSLLHFDGTNGSTSFPDTAAGIGTNLVWSNTGSGSQLSTATSKFGTASLLNAGGLQHIETPNNSNFNSLGTTPFVFDCWVNPTNFGSLMFAAGIGLRGATFSWFLSRDIANNFRFTVPGISVATSGTVTSAGWHHIACVADGSNIYIALDGVVSGPSAYSSLPNTGDVFAIGTVQFTSGVVSSPWIGNIDEARFSLGTTRGWTSNFTPSTMPYSL